MNDKIMTVSDIAEYLNIHKVTVWRLLRDKGLPGFKVGGSWRFRKERIDEWIKEKESIVKAYRNSIK